MKMPVPYEPKKNNRWVVKLPEEFDIDDWVLRATERPSAKIVDGEVIPNPISIKFYDPIGPSTAQKVFLAMVGLTTYDNDAQYDKPKMHKETMKNLKDGFDYTLELLDPTGFPIENWTISGCKLIGVDFGKLNYADDDVCSVTIILQPKSFVLLY